jgi:hypothetical protein
MSAAYWADEIFHFVLKVKNAETKLADESYQRAIDKFTDARTGFKDVKAVTPSRWCFNARGVKKPLYKVRVRDRHEGMRRVINTRQRGGKDGGKGKSPKAAPFNNCNRNSESSQSLS